jgi:hypothetical protein
MGTRDRSRRVSDGYFRRGERMKRDTLVDDFIARLGETAAGEDAFLQAVRHVVEDTITIEKASAALAAAKVLERLSEPDRTIGLPGVGQTSTNALTGWLLGGAKGGSEFDLKGRSGSRVDYRRGGNIAGYRKVAAAISAMGAI